MPHLNASKPPHRRRKHSIARHGGPGCDPGEIAGGCSRYFNATLHPIPPSFARIRRYSITIAGSHGWSKRILRSGDSLRSCFSRYGNRRIAFSRLLQSTKFRRPQASFHHQCRHAPRHQEDQAVHCRARPSRGSARARTVRSWGGSDTIVRSMTGKHRV